METGSKHSEGDGEALEMGPLRRPLTKNWWLGFAVVKRGRPEQGTWGGSTSLVLTLKVLLPLNC